LAGAAASEWWEKNFMYASKIHAHKCKEAEGYEKRANTTQTTHTDRAERDWGGSTQRDSSACTRG
jgi:hypothetical protein